MCALASLLLWEAADRGDHAAVRFLLARAKSLDARHPKSSYTPLCVAALHGHLRVVKLLVRAGAAVDTVSGGWAAVDLATANNHHHVVAYLARHSSSEDRSMSSVGSRTTLRTEDFEGGSCASRRESEVSPISSCSLSDPVLGLSSCLVNGPPVTTVVVHTRREVETEKHVPRRSKIVTCFRGLAAAVGRRLFHANRDASLKRDEEADHAVPVQSKVAAPQQAPAEEQPTSWWWRQYQ